MAQFLKRREIGREKSKEASERTVAQTDDGFAKKYPALAEFLSLEEWEPGVARERGTITVFFEQGTFKAGLNDKDGECTAYVTKPTFNGILDALEKGLVKGDLDWRNWSGKKLVKGKRS